jgi:superfamily II DNA or RNA helicase
MKILIGNSSSTITGLTSQQFDTLKKALSYVVGGSSAYFSGYGIRRKSLLSKKGEFPSGLLHRVKNIFPEAVEVRKNMPPLLKKPKKAKASPYLWQKEALAAAMQTNRGTISACTGSGKSLVIALIAARLNLKTLVVVPSLEICKQLSESLLHVLGANHDVHVYNVDSQELLRYPKEPYECLIIDEAHHSAAKTYQKLNKTMWTGIYYRYFLTATPFRNDLEETLLYETIAGEVIYRLDYRTAVKAGYVVPIEAYYIEVPKIVINAHTWAEVYRELVVNNEFRNERIFDLCHSLSIAEKSVLCLVKEVAHGMNIGIPKFVHGDDDESRKYIQGFNAREIKCLIGTEGIIGEGVDTKPCEYVILAGLGKAKSRIMQAIGRCLRQYPGKASGKVILIKDTSHKFCLHHFREQCKILKEEYGVTPRRLNL